MILESLEHRFGVKFHGQPKTTPQVKLDGFFDSEIPICVEVWAHQGAAKGSSPKRSWPTWRSSSWLNN